MDLLDELDPGEPPGLIEDYRICSQCLQWWLRSDYTRHMEQDHGFETLTITEAELNGPL